MKPVLTLLTALLLASVARVHAADAPSNAPANVRAIETSPAHIRIAWEPGANRIGGYRIWRRMA
jgi:hypothetical protein